LLKEKIEDREDSGFTVDKSLSGEDGKQHFLIIKGSF